VEKNFEVEIVAQYIKDLSFENPEAPASIIMANNQPDINLTVNINALHAQENDYEVSLHIASEAKHEKKTIFLVDVVYSGLFRINKNDKEVNLDHILFIFCPNMLFPFARSIIANVMREAGLPPLMLSPVDFYSLYQANKNSRGENKEVMN